MRKSKVIGDGGARLIIIERTGRKSFKCSYSSYDVDQTSIVSADAFEGVYKHIHMHCIVLCTIEFYTPFKHTDAVGFVERP